MSEHEILEQWVADITADYLRYRTNSSSLDPVTLPPTLSLSLKDILARLDDAVYAAEVRYREHRHDLVDYHETAEDELGWVLEGLRTARDAVARLGRTGPLHDLPDLSAPATDRVALLTDPNYSAGAIDALVSTFDEEDLGLVPRLLDLLGSPNVPTPPFSRTLLHQRVAAALARIGPAAVPLMFDALADPGRPFAPLQSALGKFEPLPAQELVRRIRQHGADPARRDPFAELLVQSGRGELAAEVLASLYPDCSDAMRRDLLADIRRYAADGRLTHAVVTLAAVPGVNADDVLVPFAEDLRDHRGAGRRRVLHPSWPPCPDRRPRHARRPALPPPASVRTPPQRSRN